MCQARVVSTGLLSVVVVLVLSAAARADDEDGYVYPTATASDTSPSPSEPKPSAVTASVHISEAIQFRIPKVDGVPNTFSNVAGGGFALTFRWLELSLQSHVIYSFTKVKVDDGVTSLSANAKGLGWDAGMRIAVGAFAKGGTQYFVYAHPQFASWHLNGEFSNGSMFEAEILEFATEFGAGMHLPVTESIALDVFAAVLHIGFRPEETEIVSATSYPTIGFSVKGRIGGRKYATSEKSD